MNEFELSEGVNCGQPQRYGHYNITGDYHSQQPAPVAMSYPPSTPVRLKRSQSNSQPTVAFAQQPNLKQQVSSPIPPAPPQPPSCKKYMRINLSARDSLQRNTLQSNDLLSDPSTSSLDDHSPGANPGVAVSSSRVDKPGRQKIDYYSIPVFILEVLSLAAVSFGAYLLHYKSPFDAWTSGFYCDDWAYKEVFKDDALTAGLHKPQDEPLFLLVVALAPIILILFCELINSMFGAVKFRRIRALCACCKLHSITRRTIRFVGAYLLGFLIVIICADVLTTTTGRLRPFFLQECPKAYELCAATQSPPVETITKSPADMKLSSGGAIQNDSRGTPIVLPLMTSSFVPPRTDNVFADNGTNMPNSSALIELPSNSFLTSIHAERRWINLNDKNLATLCGFSEDDSKYSLHQLIAKSWPSLPAAMVTYGCVFVSIYLSFVGTARPFRIITSMLIVAIMLFAVIFDVHLVKLHMHHWDDVVASIALAFAVSLFILLVYLNRFKDTHYFKNQKIAHPPRINYNDDEAGIIQMSDGTVKSQSQMPPGQYSPNSNSLSNQNDPAMRYFQIPRANYRGGVQRQQ